jgi:hypothetical protein
LHNQTPRQSSRQVGAMSLESRLMTSTRQVIDIQDILKALSAQGLHLRAVGYFAATDGNTNSRISSEFRFEELLPLLLSYLFDCIETNPHSADDSFLHSRGEAFFELPYILNIARKQTDSTLCVGLFWDWIEIKHALLVIGIWMNSLPTFLNQ